MTKPTGINSKIAELENTVLDLVKNNKRMEDSNLRTFQMLETEMTNISKMISTLEYNVKRQLDEQN